MSDSVALKPTRTIPFTPVKRPLVSSHSLNSASANETNVTSVRSSIPRNTTPSQPQSPKKFKSALPFPSETRPRLNSRAKPNVPSAPGTPTRAERPKTPSTPKRNGIDDDVFQVQVNPEDALVDYQTVEAGDVSIELDESMNKSYGQEDKVLVSIRVRPSDDVQAWNLSRPFGSSHRITLNPAYAKTQTTASQEFHFDEILTGSDNRSCYNAVARSHVCAAMDGYNAVIFAYGQTASGKSFTLSGDDANPGITPRAIKDVFSYIKRTPKREYLLRASYLEIYNETIYDLLTSPSTSAHHPVQIQGNGVLTPLREEIVTSLKSVKDVIERGNRNRRTASTDWNERSSRSHSIFRLVIESRERRTSSSDNAGERNETPSGRVTPGPSGRSTPGPSGRATPGPPPTPGGSRLQSIGGRSVQMSVLSLIDLAGSEKATSDRDRTKEGKYINTSLLTLGTVIATLAENTAKKKGDYVPYRNSKLTRMLQPSLAGNARISVIATLNPDPSAIVESNSTLLFAQRIKKVQLNAQKKEVVDTDALIERYRKEIEELRAKLSEREAESPAKRRLSAQEQKDESKALQDLNMRIAQLRKVILTSTSVDENKGDESRPVSPMKVDFDHSPYQLRQELLAARLELETKSNQILSLEAALQARPPLPADASDDEKTRVIADQAKTIRELEIVVGGYEDNLGEPLRAVREDVEREWEVKLEAERKLRLEKEAWANELVRQLEKEKKARSQMEVERRALVAFVQKFDSLGGAPSIPAYSAPPSPIKRKTPLPSPGIGTTSSASLFAERQQNRDRSTYFSTIVEESPMRLPPMDSPGPRLLDQQTPDGWPGLDDSFDLSFVSRELTSKWPSVKASENASLQTNSTDNKENTAV